MIHKKLLQTINFTLFKVSHCLTVLLHTFVVFKNLKPILQTEFHKLMLQALYSK